MRAVVKSSKFVKIKKKELQGRGTVSLRGAKEELLTLGNTWYLRGAVKNVLAEFFR